MLNIISITYADVSSTSDNTLFVNVRKGETIRASRSFQSLGEAYAYVAGVRDLLNSLAESSELTVADRRSAAE